MGLLDNIGIIPGNPYSTGNPWAAAIGGFREGYQNAADREIAAQKAQLEEDYKRQQIAQSMAQEKERLDALRKQAAMEQNVAAVLGQREQLFQGEQLTPVGQQQLQGLMGGRPETMQTANPAYDWTSQVPMEPQLNVATPEKQAVMQQLRDMDTIPKKATSETLINAIALTHPLEATKMMQNDELKSKNMEWGQEKLRLQIEANQAMAAAKDETARERIAREYDAKLAKMQSDSDRDLSKFAAMMARGQQEKPLSQKDRIIMEGKHGKQIQNINNGTSLFTSFDSDLEYMLDPKNQAAFDANFGWTGLQKGTSVLTPAARDMKAVIERVRNSAETKGLEVVKDNSGGIGAIALGEWPKMGATVANTSDWTTPGTARKNFSKFRTLVQDSQKNLEQSYHDTWESTPFYAPDKVRKAGSSSGTNSNKRKSLADY